MYTNSASIGNYIITEVENIVNVKEVNNMSDNKTLTADFVAAIKQAKETDKIAINAFLAGMNLQQEIDRAKESA